VDARDYPIVRAGIVAALHIDPDDFRPRCLCEEQQRECRSPHVAEGAR